MNCSIRLLLVGLSLSASLQAADLPAMNDAEKQAIRAIVKETLREYAAVLNDKQPASGDAKKILGEIVRDNRAFMRKNKPTHFAPFADAQHPRATVVACADSRVHSHALDATPDGDLFVVRNIGNQLVTAEGSVEYGVQHMNTPLLLIVGHVACGAIKAAAGDYSRESPVIRRELDTLQTPKGEPGLGSVRLNVNNQVRQAMHKFEERVIAGRLTVVGAVYDFNDEMRQGLGKLNIINVNGETNPAKIANLELMRGLDAPGKGAGGAR